MVACRCHKGKHHTGCFHMQVKVPKATGSFEDAFLILFCFVGLLGSRFFHLLNFFFIREALHSDGSILTKQKHPCILGLPETGSLSYSYENSKPRKEEENIFKKKRRESCLMMTTNLIDYGIQPPGDRFRTTTLQPIQSVYDPTEDLPLNMLNCVKILRVHMTNLMVKKPLHSPLLKLQRLSSNRQACHLFLLQLFPPHQGKSRCHKRIQVAKKKD
ncbi:hypothetical protein QYM36_011124 [Artemia franciscana]|uniref:Uncharacterized protein n=1 Tax=Artemia franciscana TaxID=6661 RepID=A0AA88HRS7_ARTSF|nr:hypothetical protein QYM36_011124 [Artemia franciscana]